MIAATVACAGCGRIAFDPPGGTGDGGVLDAPDSAVPITCASAVLEDGFDDDTIDATLWFSNASTESGGALSLVPDELGVYQGLFSRMSYDFRDRGLAFAFDAVPAAGTGGAVGVRTKVASEQDFTYLEVRDGMLRGGLNTPSSGTPRFTAPYDPVDHRVLRMRVTTGTLFWETSPDASSWTVLDMLNAPALLRDATLWVYAYDVQAPLDTAGRVEHVVLCAN